MPIKTIAVFIPTHFSVGRGLFRGVARYIRTQTDWRLLTSGTPDMNRLSMAREHHADGIVVFAANAEITTEILRMRIPAVNLSSTIAPGPLPTVTTDDHAIGVTVARYFLGLGYRNLAYSGYPAHYYSVKRGQGFTETIAAAGYSCHVRNEHHEEVEGTDLTWLNGLPKPVGIMACNDYRGRRIVEACQKAEINVPGEVAVVGVDNDDVLCELCTPPMASVITRPEQVGAAAVTLLARMLAGARKPRRPILIAPGDVVVRQSADALAVEDPDLIMVIRYLRENLQRRLTFAQVIEAVPVARRSIEIQFRHQLNITPGRYLRRLRVERARALLTTSMMLEEIAQACGFASAIRLNEAFKRETGTTPGRYRRQFRSH